ncbi:hypothetical protein P153DRAFT_370283 [Dothidotthia symphoricarpi CBS 119687]|uniref:Uncharacterized protein n=1 Tax=Dothidotthia symphoricarpi CBS 119687 TaxID=1392245 RepID=A0A6A6A1B9_9PLEO|nr:uncharacterized protein P153DRAFT_370283 [Dothidotthia symphoricarpi CBS 119687]KAF2124954.1 hypothetical protein P153DRAFT_370283 [Dothidotthia symphoricarpi CBS 119687]
MSLFALVSNGPTSYTKLVGSLKRKLSQSGFSQTNANLLTGGSTAFLHLHFSPSLRPNPKPVEAKDKQTLSPQSPSSEHPPRVSDPQKLPPFSNNPTEQLLCLSQCPSLLETW